MLQRPLSDKQKKERGVSGHLTRLRSSRALTVRPDHNFFCHKWCIFVLLQREQLIGEPGSVVSAMMYLTTKMCELRICIDVRQHWGSEV